VFTFLGDESVDDVVSSVSSGDHVTPKVDDATSDAKHDDSASGSGELFSTEPLAAATDTDTSANGFLTSSPTKSSEDVADLEFKGNEVV